jgi:hypothetical protein
MREKTIVPAMCPRSSRIDFATIEFAIDPNAMGAARGTRPKRFSRDASN